MNIACLGWGSLIWDPRDLRTRGDWFEDGPAVPVELARQSSDGRMTLVIEPAATPVRVLWIMMSLTDVYQAREALRCREGKNSRIGQWLRGQGPPDLIPELPEWADGRALDAVIWTALGPKFNGQEVTPSAEQVVYYLRSLGGGGRAKAEQYVRFAPRQIDSEYRRRIEEELGWTYVGGLR